MDLGLSGRIALVAGEPGTARAACARVLAEEGAVVTEGSAGELLAAPPVTAGDVAVVVLLLPGAVPDPVDALPDRAALERAWQPVTEAVALYRAVLPGMRGRGSGRVVAVVPAAVKAIGAGGADLDTVAGLGLLGVHKALAAEDGVRGVTANAVVRGTGAGDGDVADLVAWLASTSAGYVTGTAVGVDGGTTPSVF